MSRLAFRQNPERISTKLVCQVYDFSHFISSYDEQSSLVLDILLNKMEPMQSFTNVILVVGKYMHACLHSVPVKLENLHSFFHYVLCPAYHGLCGLASPLLLPVGIWRKDFKWSCDGRDWEFLLPPTSLKSWIYFILLHTHSTASCANLHLDRNPQEWQPAAKPEMFLLFFPRWNLDVCIFLEKVNCNVTNVSQRAIW